MRTILYSTYVCTLLEKNGFQTRSAGSLSSARKMLAGCEEDDIILADLRLPDGESIGLLRQMRIRAWDSRHCHDRLRRSAHTAVESMKLGSAITCPRYWLRKLLPLTPCSKSRTEEICPTPVFKRKERIPEHQEEHPYGRPTRIGVLILGETARVRSILPGWYMITAG